MSDPLQIPAGLPDDHRPTPPSGLTDREARGRKPNETKADPAKSVWQIIAGNLFTLFNLLNVALAVCLALVGSWRNMLFLGVVVSNTLIGTIQELRARHTIRKLTLLSAPQACVLRGGAEHICAPDELVEGDLVILRAGDQVMADAIVTEGSGAANESLLTGESDPVRKSAGDWLMSGSYITEGRLTAQLVYVGDDAYAARLTRSARKIKRPKSALMTDLNKLIRFVSIVLVPLGVLLFLKQHFILKSPLTDAVPSTVAAMIGMIPEGLMLLTSVAMAAGVVKLGRHNTLVQELYGIETLARADVLCLDKTGTITTGRMIVHDLIPISSDKETLTRSVARFLGAMDEHSGTLDALRLAVDPLDEAPVATLPFSSARKKSAASFADGTTLVLGAPSFVLSSDLLEAIQARVAAAADEGCRVLALAECSGCITELEVPPVTRVLGLCILTDEVRDSAPDTLRYFGEQGVTIKIISGDDPRTVAAIARRVALEGEAVDASALSDEELTAVCERCTVFGRVTPAQKKLLVKALKHAGHSVAMTGDGVNDIPALKSADCSIAMAGGADAAKHAAQLTLLDADFASMPLIVGEGRRVIGNITRASSLFLVKTLYSFALAALLLFIPAEYPFQPIQLTLVSTLTIGAPSFFLALEPNRARVQGHFLQTVLLRAVPGAAAVTVCAALSMLGPLLGWSQEACSTLATLSAGSVGLMMLMTVCRPLTKLRAVVWSVMAAAFVLSVLLLGQAFFLVTLNAEQCAALVLLIALGAAVMAGTTWLMKRRQRRRAQTQTA
ncbi:MAG: HAD-IC family P-type ATPase [Clostridia bacterium]|nr:HAD-IC family P-type ATPase [Clostridia bacterium]